MSVYTPQGLLPDFAQMYEQYDLNKMRREEDAQKASEFQQTHALEEQKQANVEENSRVTRTLALADEARTAALFDADMPAYLKQLALTDIKTDIEKRAWLATEGVRSLETGNPGLADTPVKARADDLGTAKDSSVKADVPGTVTKANESVADVGNYNKTTGAWESSKNNVFTGKLGVTPPKVTRAAPPVDATIPYVGKGQDPQQTYDDGLAPIVKKYGRLSPEFNDYNRAHPKEAREAGNY